MQRESHASSRLTSVSGVRKGKVLLSVYYCGIDGTERAQSQEQGVTVWQRQTMGGEEAEPNTRKITRRNIN